MKPAYYNDNDPFAAQWLRNLVKAGHIAPGDVDDRSLSDVRPDDLAGYGQCHFFAGLGGWSRALRLAGWPDDRPVWTGSCPCQPFSAAGRGGGDADERHLWPHWFHLIGERRPAIVLGEQVASRAGLGWLDLVCADMEAAGYAVGAADLCAAGIGAPHIRQRLWFVGKRLEHTAGDGRRERRAEPGQRRAEPRRGDGGLADAGRQRQQGQHALLQPGQPRQADAEAAGSGETGGLADADDARPQGWRQPGRERAAERSARAGGVAGGLADAAHGDGWRGERGAQAGTGADGIGRWRPSGDGDHGGPGTIDGFWRDPDWLWCRDDKWRPVEPGTFPLAHGISGRVGRLRAYGNAIIPQVAATFIETVMDIPTEDRKPAMITFYLEAESLDELKAKAMAALGIVNTVKAEAPAAAAPEPVMIPEPVAAPSQPVEAKPIPDRPKHKPRAVKPSVARQKEIDEGFRKNWAEAEAAAAAAPTPEPLDDVDLSSFEDDDTTAVSPVDTLANEKLKAEVIDRLADLFTAGKVKLLRSLLDSYGSGAKTFAEIDAGVFPSIRDAMQKGMDS